jgi:hypothetical protein
VSVLIANKHPWIRTRAVTLGCEVQRARGLGGVRDVACPNLAIQLFEEHKI